MTNQTTTSGGNINVVTTTGWRPSGWGSRMLADRPHEDLTRVWHASPFDQDAVTPKLRAEEAEDDAEGPIMYGHFARWNEWNEINSPFEGNFMERLSPTSMDESFERMTPKAIFDHGFDPYIGMKPIGTPTMVKADDHGPAYEVALYRSVPDLLLDGLVAGAYGASYRFSIDAETRVDEPEPSDDNPGGLPEVTLDRVSVKEFGPTAFGADPLATAGVRSTTDRFVRVGSAGVWHGIGTEPDEDERPDQGRIERATQLRALDLERFTR